MAEFTVEGLLISIIAVLPGFVSAAVRSVLVPGETAEAGEWLAQSIVASLVFNAIAVFVFILFMVDFKLGESVESLQAKLAATALSTTLEYVATLYGLALGWGLISGTAQEYAPRVIAHRLRLTPVGPEPTVFRGVLKEQFRTRENKLLRGKPEQKVPWLRVARADLVVLGRLRHSSVDFAVNHPIEVFLSPVHLFKDGKRLAESVVLNEKRSGAYMRLLSKDIVEFFCARADWDPTAAAASQSHEHVRSHRT